MTTEERQALIRQRVADLDKLDPQVPIRLRKTDYILELDNTAVKAIFKETGVDLLMAGALFEVTDKTTVNLKTGALEPVVKARLEDPNFAGVMLYCALLRHHPEMTQEVADGLWGPRQRLIVQAALRVCTDLFYPDIKDIPEADDQPKEEKALDPTPLPRKVGSATGPLPEDSEYLGESSGAAR